MNQLDKILKEIESIKVDNNEILLAAQKTMETTSKLIEDTNKLTFKLQDIEYRLKMMEE